MCQSLRVRWTITPKIPPQPWIICNGCGGLRAFRSSDKIRLNANGRKLDAWLIYKCTVCDRTWNRTIFERRNVRHVDPTMLRALQSNNPDWVRAEAFNLEALRRESSRIDEFAEFDVRKELLRETAGWTRLEIEFSISLAASARFDRLLATELHISRARLNSLYESGLLTTSPTRTGMLRRRIRDGLCVTVDLSDWGERELVWRPLAVGSNAP